MDQICGNKPILSAVFALVLLTLSAPALAGQASNPAANDQAPAASSGPGLSGYMDFHFTKRQFEDGVLDFHRFVLLVTHAITPRIRFVSELELEHAFVEGLEEAGELELEQAYLDFLISRGFNVRAGMLLVPIGIINERHEPPVFYGVERPLVDTVIVPSTWFEAGAGVHGEVGRGWRYRAYVTAPLDASAFSAEEGLRDGRQKGSEANARRVATTGRIEYVGMRGLTAGGGFWEGRSGFEFQPDLEIPVRVVEADARYAIGRFEFRGQVARVFIGNAGELNDRLTLRTGVNPNIARQLFGVYGEASYRVLAGARGEVGVFARYERADTQFRMPAGTAPLREFDRRLWVTGLTYWPDPDVAVKFDYTFARNRSVFEEADVVSIGLGWWF